MLTNIYVIDYILKDLNGAKARLDRVFGTEPLWISPDMVPGQAFDAMYYQIPGNGERSHALGYFQEGATTLPVAQDRLWLIGVMCEDLDGTIAEISARGLKFVHEKPQEYAVGRSNTLGVLHGLEVFIAEHVPGGDKKAREVMFTKDGSSDFGDETQGGIFIGFDGIDLAVHDLDAACRTFTAVFGVEPEDTTARTAEPGVRSVQYPAPGNGAGMRGFGLFALDGDAKGGLAGRVAHALATNGEGAFRLDLRVTDVPSMRALLDQRGVQVGPGPGLVLEDVHGTDLRFVTV